MKQIKLQVSRLNAIQMAVFLLIFGVFLGVLSANVFRDSFAKQLWSYEEDIFTEIVGKEINYAGLFRYILVNNFNNFIMFWLFSVTILGIPYMALKITSFGFFSGFFISAVTMQYGLKGILLIFTYVFPHGLMYLPISVISLLKGFQLCREIYQTNHNTIGGFLKPIRSYLFLILVLAIALVFASFLEAYPGAYLLKKALNLFS
jgi:stage II sporulation protein M